MRHLLRRVLRVLVVLALLPVIALALALAVANTTWGLAQLARVAEWATAGTSSSVAIEGLSGRFPDRLAASRIAVSDQDGTWLVVEDVAFSWSPLDLLRRRATVDAVTAGRLALLRAPRATGPAGEGGGGVPVAVALQRLEIARIELPILGATLPAVALRGMAGLGGESASLQLVGDALDGARGSYRIDAALSRDRISAAIVVEEPQSEAFGTLLPLFERQPLSLNARLDGPRDGAAFDMRFSAGALQVEGDGQVDLMRMTGDLRIAGSAAAMPLIAGVGWASVSVVATLSGPFAAPSLDAAIDATQLAAGGASVAVLRIAAHAAASAGRTELHVSAVAEQVRVPGPAPDALAAAPIEAELSATLAGGAIALTGARIRHPLLSLRAQGRSDGTALAGQASLDVASLRPALDMVGQAGDGTLQLAIALSGAPKAPTIAVTGRGGLSDGPAAARALLGPDARLRATIRGDAAVRRVVVDALRLEGAAMVVEGEANLSPEAADARWQLRLVDLGVLATGVAGALDVGGTVEGRLDDLVVTARMASDRLTRESLTLAPFTADVAVRGLPASPRATLRMTGRMNDAPLLVVGNGAAQPGGPWTAILEQATLPGVTVQGDASGRAMLQAATLRLDATDLAPLGSLLGMRLRGAATIDVALRQPPGATPETWPEGAIEARLRDVTVNGAAEIGTASLRAEARGTMNDPSVTLQLAAERVAASGARLASVRVELDGPVSAMRARLAAEGPDAAAQLSGTIRPNDGPTIDLAPGSLRWRGETIALQGTTRIALGDGVRIDDLRLALRGGSVNASGRVGGSGNDLRVTIARLPLALAEIVAPDMGLSGSVDGDLRLRGTPAAPQGQLRATVREARVATGTPRLLPPVNATITADLAGDHVRIDAAAQAGAATQLRAQGRVPLQQAGALDLRVIGALDLAMTDLFLAAQGRLMRGRATLDATLRGSASAPAIAGRVSVADGRLEDAVNGLRIAGLAGGMIFRDQVLEVGPVRGRIGGGEIALAGRIGVLEPGVPVDLRLTTRGGRVVDSPIATVAADAEISVRGRAAEEIAVTGPVTVHRAEFRIAESLPPSLPTLLVREVGGTAQQRALTVARSEQARDTRAPRPAAAPAGPRVLLDIPIAMPRAVFVRGRGLEAEVGGDLRLRSTGGSPTIEGALNLRRGTFEVVGQRLTFRRGALTFDPGAGVDPTLDLDASTSAGGVTATIHVGGRASAPTLTLSSDPALPQDEILSRMLFGTAAGGLSPLQMLRVASAVAELGGIRTGGDVTDRLRRGLGLDVLSVQDVSGGGVGGEAGRYVREGVYVGVRSGRSTSDGSQQTQGVVQIEVLPNLKLEAGAGTTGRVGVTYERDY